MLFYGSEGTNKTGGKNLNLFFPSVFMVLHGGEMIVLQLFVGYSHHSEADVGIPFCTVPHDIGFLAAAVITFGVPTAAFNDIRTIHIC